MSMDAEIAYEMRVRFRQDMAELCGKDWRPERLPKLEPPGGGAIVPWRNNMRREDRSKGTGPRGEAARVVALARAGYSLQQIPSMSRCSEDRAWAILARWAPDLLPKEAANG